MQRRTVLAMLAAAAADPERLFWIPGRKLISIPAVRVPTAEEVVRTAMIEGWKRYVAECFEVPLTLVLGDPINKRLVL